MDKNLNEDKLYQSDAIRFKQIFEYKSPIQSLKDKRKRLDEYTFMSGINEEGEDEQQGAEQPMDPNQPAPNMGGQQNMQQAQGGQPMGGDMNTQPQGPDMGGQGMPMDGGGQQPMQDMGMQQSQMGDMGQEMPPMDDQQGGMPGEEGVDDVEMEGSEDEVIDVDELTQSQEATEYKLDGVDDRLSDIYKVVSKLSDQLNQNAENIMALKSEFEKRNPTEEEKLNLRSISSAPYTETPKDYWDRKAKSDPHYDVMYNNDVSPSDEQEEFKIRKSDIMGLNMKDISDTLNIKQNLSDYLGF